LEIVLFPDIIGIGRIISSILSVDGDFRQIPGKRGNVK